ncbi:multicopper oxidase domain-containing protein [Prosthecobacter sp.]|uniref:multicopper oxidase domain-containing protein n=1 Tax=Prosthecobacter sp. TaxID=1965333 RepID=UPI00248A0F3A|nr:multicopper oxidase domain-containing protein [Prosthecobacter sp.]MDI1310536.1 multicopper oxidase domain-containing protein [Prosthecobacter sp.]
MRYHTISTLVWLVLLSSSPSLWAKTVNYDLNLSEMTVNFSGKEQRAMAINGSIPGPTLRFAEGDDAVIRVKNNLKEDTSLHWHGILLPNDQDGVPHVNMAPIKPGETREFRFRLRHGGTFWYHSHSGLQEQLGIYGSIAITPKGGERIKTDHDLVVVLSDWTNESPYDVLAQLRAGFEWQQIKKGTAQSIVGAIQHNALPDMVKRSMRRMPPMDFSDVGYDAFLANGKPAAEFPAQPGETVRLRLINASAASYYHLEYAGGPMKIIAADGTDVQPVATGRFLFAIAETYDLLVKVPQRGGAWELRATSQDGTGHSSLFIGQGERHAAPDVPKPNVYKGMSGMGDMSGMSGMSDMKGMDHSSMVGMGEGDIAAPEPAMDHSAMAGMKGMPPPKPTKKIDAITDMKGMDHSTMPMPAVKQSRAAMKDMPSMAGMHGMDDPERPGSPYEKLRALHSTVISDSRPLREYTFRLQGDMIRFVWTLDGKTFSEADMINVRRGEKVRFTFINDSMMHHPMHLHGHFFRLVTSAGNLSPMKHTIDVPPMSSHTIEFAADEPGDWMMHCHVLYHLAIGMARVVHYEDAPPNPHLMTGAMMTEHDPKLLFGEGTLLSNMTEGTISLENNRNGLMAHWQSRIGNGSDTDYELGIDYDRFITSNLSTFAGMEWSNGINDNRGMFGARYLLPFLVQSQVSVDTDGDFRFTISKVFPITARLSLFGRAQYDTKAIWETTVGAEYFLHRNLSLVGQWHNQYGWGAGVGFRF